jgi:hypothetical protein
MLLFERPLKQKHLSKTFYLDRFRLKHVAFEINKKNVVLNEIILPVC